MKLDWDKLPTDAQIAYGEKEELFQYFIYVSLFDSNHLWTEDDFGILISHKWQMIRNRLVYDFGYNIYDIVNIMYTIHKKPLILRENKG
jgi:hypothetical protein